MTALTRNPDTINFLSPLGAKMVLERAPNLVFHIQSMRGSGIQMFPVLVPTPLIQLPHEGDQIEPDQLIIEFKIDENLANYKEIFNWIKGLGHPDQLTEHKTLRDSTYGLRSDVSVFVLNSAMNPNKELVFREAFPLSLTPFQFDTRDSTVNYITATVVFQYQFIDIKDV